MKTSFALFVSGLALALPLSLPGATNTWLAGSGDWGVAANWSTGAVPAPTDLVIIASGPAITVTHSSNIDTVLSVQCQQALVISGGSVTVTSNASSVTGSFTISNGATLGASGVGTTFSCSGPATADDANFSIAGGAVVSLPTLQNFTKECNGANWTVTGTNSELNLPGLTNITGQPCNYPTIQAEAGGQILATNLVSIQAGPLYFYADGTNSLIDFPKLSACAGQNNYLVSFEASLGGTVQISNMTSGPLVGVTLNPGGTIPTAQIQMLNMLVLMGVTNNLNALTNLANLTINNATMNFPALADFDDGNVTLSAGASVTMPVLRNYNKYCNGAYWTVTGSNTVFNLPALTNITGQACNFPTIEAEAGGQILATNLVSIQAGPLYFYADGTNSLINLSGLTTCAGQSGYMVTFEASLGGTVQIPKMTGGPLVGVTINPGGTIPTAQIQTLNTLELAGGANNFNALTNLLSLTASGGTMSFPALTNFDTSSIALSGGAVVTMPALQSYYKDCNGGSWTVTGSNSVLNLPALTNISGAPCFYSYIEAESGGQIWATNLASIEAAPLYFQADGTNSLIDLSALTTGSGEGGYLLTFEASAGGTILMSNMTGGPLVGVTVNPGGSIPTAQIQMLNTLGLAGVTNNLNALTNLLNLTASGVTVDFPALTNFDTGSIALSGGAVVTMPAVQSYYKDCNGGSWIVTGPNSVLNFPALTNITGIPCFYSYIEAEAGGQILATNLASIEAGPIYFQADGANSLIDLSGLTTGSGEGGYLLTFEASNGGTILMPNMRGGPLVGVTLNPGGTISTAALTNLVSLTASSVTMNFPALINFDTGSIALSGGAVVTMPALQSYYKDCNGGSWTVTGANSVLNLPALTNISGVPCFYSYIEAEAGGQILATNLASIEAGPLYFQADGANSLIDLSGLTNGAGQGGYLLTFEASSGGTLRIQNLATGFFVGLTFNSGGAMTPSNLANLNQGSITLPAGSLSLPALRDIDATSLSVSGGAVLTLPAVGNYNGGTNVGATWQSSGSGSILNLPALTNLIGDGSASYPMQIEAQSGGDLVLSNLQAIANGNMAILANGAGSTINLTDLSGFVLQNGQGSLTAENGGAILLNSSAFVLANVSINIPAGNPVLPPTLIASSTLTLYGQPWHSYLVEDRNTLIPNSPFVFLARVALTNAFQPIEPSLIPNAAYLVTDFVANPAIIDSFNVDGDVQLILYGLTNANFEILTATNLAHPITWTSNSTIAMTNAFRIFAPITPSLPQQYYRAKQL